MRIAILRYGVGNVYSVRAGLERLGARPLVVETLSEAMDADALILPGVGAYPAAMRRLSWERERLLSLISSGVPVLGICLGMQLFFEESEEGGPGLGLLPGRVERLRAPRLPHIGWSRVWPLRGSELLDGVEPGSYFYFAHSYAVHDTSQPWARAAARHGDSVFAAVVEAPPLYGTQFHPERSDGPGSRVLANFVSAARR